MLQTFENQSNWTVVFGIISIIHKHRQHQNTAVRAACFCPGKVDWLYRKFEGKNDAKCGVRDGSFLAGGGWCADPLMPKLQFIIWASSNRMGRTRNNYLLLFSAHSKCWCAIHKSLCRSVASPFVWKKQIGFDLHFEWLTFSKFIVSCWASITQLTRYSNVSIRFAVTLLLLNWWLQWGQWKEEND